MVTSTWHFLRTHNEHKTAIRSTKTLESVGISSRTVHDEWCGETSEWKWCANNFWEKNKSTRAGVVIVFSEIFHSLYDFNFITRSGILVSHHEFSGCLLPEFQCNGNFLPFGGDLSHQAEEQDIWIYYCQFWICQTRSHQNGGLTEGFIYWIMWKIYWVSKLY